MQLMRETVAQLNEELMDDMQETLWTDYGVNVNTSEWNRKVTDDWDKAQSLVSSASHKFTYQLHVDTSVMKSPPSPRVSALLHKDKVFCVPPFEYLNVIVSRQFFHV